MMAGWDEKGELATEQVLEATGMTAEELAAWTERGYSFARPRRNGLWGKRQTRILIRARAGENATALDMGYEGL